MIKKNEGEKGKGKGWKGKGKNVDLLNSKPYPYTFTLYFVEDAVNENDKEEIYQDKETTDRYLQHMGQRRRWHQQHDTPNRFQYILETRRTKT